MAIHAVLSQLDARAHESHSLHREQRVFVESNCYLDSWIEVLHALALDPRAMLFPALAVDFEGDQWTFVKPGLDDLKQLYGVDVPPEAAQ